MSRSLEIRKEAKARIIAAAFATTVIRRKRNFNDHELPAVCIYPGERSVRSKQSDKYAMDAELYIEYHDSTESLTDDEIDDKADAMIDQIRLAIEIEPRQFTDRIILYPGVAYVSDEIENSESNGGVVSVLVKYDIQHIQTQGQT